MLWRHWCLGCCWLLGINLGDGVVVCHGGVIKGKYAPQRTNEPVSCWSDETDDDALEEELEDITMRPSKPRYARLLMRMLPQLAPQFAGITREDDDKSISVALSMFP